MSNSVLLTRFVAFRKLLNPLLITQSSTQAMKHSTDEKSSNCSETKSTKKKRGKTPKGRLDEEFDDAPESYAEKEPLKPHPGGVNPNTGEIGGPRGPEPTRYGGNL